MQSEDLDVSDEDREPWYPWRPKGWSPFEDKTLQIWSDHTAFPPDEEEQHAANELAILHGEVESLKQQLTDSRRLYRVKKDEVYSIRAQRAPITRLPDDLLLHIFDVCLATEPPLTLSFRKNPPSPVLPHTPWYRSTILSLPHQVNLSHVCRRWRKLVLETGKFWANIKMDHIPSSEHKQFETYLERSARAMLHVIINRSPDRVWGQVHPSGRCPRMFRLFRIVVDRLESLSMDTCERTCEGILVEFQDRLAHLRALTLHTSNCNKSGSPSSSDSEAPRLPPAPKVVLPSLECAMLKGTLFGLKLIDLNTIKSLTLDLDDLPFSSPENVLYRLNGCLSLEALHINHFYFRYTPAEDRLFSITLPALKALYIKHTQTAVPLAWISCMTLPALRTLGLGHMKRRRSWMNGDEVPWPSPDDRARCFQLHPTIKELELTYARSSEIEMQHILDTLQLVREGMLPRLESLHFQPDDEAWDRRRCPSWPRSVRRAVTDMLRVRQMKQLPLRNLRVRPPLVSGDGRDTNYAVDSVKIPKEAYTASVESLQLDSLFEPCDRAEI